MYRATKTFGELLNHISQTEGTFLKKNIISEKDCIVSDDRRLSEIFNEHFINITKTLDLKPSIIATTINLPKITETFKDHPSIKKIFSK